MANYPGSAPSFTAKSPGQTIASAGINAIADEVTAIGSALLTGLAHSLTVNGHVVFPATQNASADPNTLDDYEEGTFTPAITSAGGGAATYSAQVGNYIKVGKLVWVGGRFTMATKGTLGAGAISVNVPFVIGATGWGGMTVNFYSNMATSVAGLQILTSLGTALMPIQYVAAGGATGSASALVSDIGATFDLVFAGCYMASA